jgi:hypothetical protein
MHVWVNLTLRTVASPAQERAMCARFALYYTRKKCVLNAAGKG